MASAKSLRRQISNRGTDFLSFDCVACHHHGCQASGSLFLFGAGMPDLDVSCGRSQPKFAAFPASVWHCLGTALSDRENGALGGEPSSARCMTTYLALGRRDGRLSSGDLRPPTLLAVGAASPCPRRARGLPADASQPPDRPLEAARLATYHPLARFGLHRGGRGGPGGWSYTAKEPLQSIHRYHLPLLPDPTGISVAPESG